MAFTQYIPRPSGGGSLFDMGQLDALKREVRNGASAATDKKVAQQFEAMFIQMLLKQAHQPSMLSGPFDSQQTRMAQSLGDQQMALQLSDPGIGLAQALLAQINARRGVTASTQAASTPPELEGSRVPGLRSRIGPDIKPGSVASISGLINMLGGTSAMGMALAAVKDAPDHIRSFVSAMSGAAKTAAGGSGVPLKLMLGQAALESGWGTRQIRDEDGKPSYNLFGIKAGSGWAGKVVNVLTTEYQDGVPRKVMQLFRAYDSYEASFADYAKLISQSPRYQDVMAAPSAEAAAQKMQDAGYATDPAYASKLISIMGYFKDLPA